MHADAAEDDKMDADAAGEDEVDAGAAEEDKEPAPTELGLQNGIKAAQLQPDTDQDEVMSQLGPLDQSDKSEAAGSEASAAGEAEEPIGAVDDVMDDITAAAEQGASGEEAPSGSAEGPAVLELIGADEPSPASDTGQLLETVNSRSGKL